MKDKITVVHKNLGKEKAWGMAYKDTNEIFIDKRLKGKNHFLTLNHEVFHLILPELVEERVECLSQKLTDILWEQGYRKVDL